MVLEVYVGRDNTVKIKLAADPQGTATVTLWPRNTNRLFIENGVLTFNSGNWNVDKDLNVFVFPNVEDGANPDVMYEVRTSWGGFKTGVFSLTASTVGAVDLTIANPYLGIGHPSDVSFTATVLGRITALDVSPTDTGISVLISRDNSTSYPYVYTFVNTTDGSLETLNLGYTHGTLNNAKRIELPLSSPGAQDQWYIWVSYDRYNQPKEEGISTHKVSTRSGSDTSTVHNSDTEQTVSTQGLLGFYKITTDTYTHVGPTAVCSGPHPNPEGEHQSTSYKFTDAFICNVRRTNLPLTITSGGYSGSDYNMNIGNGRFINIEWQKPATLDGDFFIEYWGHTNSSNVPTTSGSVVSEKMIGGNGTHRVPHTDYEDYPDGRPPTLAPDMSITRTLEVRGLIDFQS